MKESFLLYNSFYEPIKYLSDEQLGRLFRAIFNYSSTGKITEDKEILVAFMFIKNQLDLDAKKYEDIKKKRSQAGKKHKGNQYTKWNKMEQMNQNGTNGSVNDNDNVNVNDNDIIINNNNKINNTLSCKVKEIISYLNQPDTEEPVRSFKSSTEKTKKLINARLKEGFNVEDFKDVIFYKYNQWVKKPIQFKNGVMSDTYYRPETLFSNNFESYLQEYKEKSK